MDNFKFHDLPFCNLPLQLDLLYYDEETKQVKRYIGWFQGEHENFICFRNIDDDEIEMWSEKDVRENIVHFTGQKEDR